MGGGLLTGVVTTGGGVGTELVVSIKVEPKEGAGVLEGVEEGGEEGWSREKVGKPWERV